MTSWAHLPAERRELLESLVAEYAKNYGRGRTTLGIDGASGSGKTRFADDLAAAFRRAGFEVFRASLDDFHRPRALRYTRGRYSPDGYYEDSFDYSVFRRVLIEPFLMGGSTGFVLAAFDLDRDVPIEPVWVTAPADAILIVEGVFVNRPVLRGIWHFTIWLETDEMTRHERMVSRDGADPDPGTPHAMRYSGAQELYFAEGDPRTAASVIVDNADFDHPRRILADSC